MPDKPGHPGPDEIRRLGAQLLPFMREATLDSIFRVAGTPDRPIRTASANIESINPPRRIGGGGGFAPRTREILVDPQDAGHFLQDPGNIGRIVLHELIHERTVGGKKENYETIARGPIAGLVNQLGRLWRDMTAAEKQNAINVYSGATPEELVNMGQPAGVVQALTFGKGDPVVQEQEVLAETIERGFNLIRRTANMSHDERKAELDLAEQELPGTRLAFNHMHRLLNEQLHTNPSKRTRR